MVTPGEPIGLPERGFHPAPAQFEPPGRGEHARVAAIGCGGALALGLLGGLVVGLLQGGLGLALLYGLATGAVMGVAWVVVGAGSALLVDRTVSLDGQGLTSARRLGRAQAIRWTDLAWAREVCRRPRRRHVPLSAYAIELQERNGRLLVIPAAGVARYAELRAALSPLTDRPEA